MMKSRAAVLRGLNQDFEITDIEVAPIQSDEVRMRIVATGVCHTDAVAQSLEGLFPLPGILGHEGAGIIEAVGENVTGFAIGDRALLSFAACHHCDHCLEGHPSVCESFNDLNFGGKLSDGTSPYSIGDQALNVFFGQSSFSQYINVKASNVVNIGQDDSIDLALLGPLGCGLQTGAGTVLNTLRPKAQDSLVVFGAGTVGLSAVMAAKATGVSPIIVVDIHDHRLALAKELGATSVINGLKEDVLAVIGKLTKGGAHYAIETTGVSSVVKQAVAATKPLGTIAILGITGEVTFNIQEEIMAEGKTLKGVIEGDSIPQVFIPKLLSLYKNGQFPFDKLVKFYPLEEINQAFADSASGAVIKPIIKMD